MPPPIRYLILWLTDACNLRCRYCYRPPVEQPRSLPLEVAEKAIALALAASLPVHLQLSGGEPTLVPELLTALLQRLQSRPAHLTVGLQTNATCLTPELVQLLQAVRVQVGVSLDGPPAVHDALRGGFAATYAGLQILETYGVPFRVTTVVTSTNVATLDLLVLLLAQFRQAQGLGLDLLTVKGTALAGQVWPAPPEALRQGVENLLQTLAFVNRKRSQPLRLREADTLWRAWWRQESNSFCHAGRGESLAVAPDGTLYPCGQTCGEPLLALGTIWQPDWRRRTALSAYARPRQAACQDCPLTTFCPGDCPSRLLYNLPAEATLACVLYQTIWNFWQNKNNRRQAPPLDQGDRYATL